MKSLVVVLFATAASAFATAAAAAPFNYNDFYLVTFNEPGGAFQHCIGLTETQQDQSAGYKYSGTWVDTDFPSTSGTWVVFNAGHGYVFHLAGPVNGTGFLTIDGKVGLKVANTTFDYFDSSGTYFAAGSASAAVDANCSASAKRPNNSRSFTN